MKFRHLPWSGVCLMLAMSSAAQSAGGPYAVDDTLIAPERGFLLETWYGREGSGTDERVAVINYGWSQRSELSLGLARERDAGERTRLLELGGKHVLTSPAPGGLGIALAANVITNIDDDRFQGVDAYVPVDVPVDNGRFVFRYNLGWSHDRDSGDRNALIWGFGGDLVVVPAMSAIAEIRGSERDRSEVQTGVRFDLGFDAELDVVHGWERRDPDTRWWTVGLALEF